MRKVLAVLAVLLLVLSASAAPRETKVKMVCMEVSEAEARKLMTHYCRDFKIVADNSDYMLILAKTPDKDQPYLFTVTDSIDGDVVEASKRSELSGAIKSACSSMHIRFGEGQANQ